VDSEDGDGFEIIELDQFKQIPFVEQLYWFHLFFFLIMAVSVARVLINIMIFGASLKEATGMTFMKFESYAILTELGSCLILYIYYRSVTKRTQHSRADSLSSSKVKQQSSEESKEIEP